MTTLLAERYSPIDLAAHDAFRRLRAAHVEPATASTVVLALIEALGNVARHASPPGKPVKFDVKLVVRRGYVVVDVVDYGPGFELRSCPMPEPLAEAGRGIPLMQRLCDSLAYRRGTKRNHLILRKRIA